MERSFLLPLPKFQDDWDLPKDFSWNPIHAQSDIAKWSHRLDRLTKNQNLWPQIRKDLQKISDSDWICLSHFSSNSFRQTILHLAIQSDQLECISLLKSDRILRERRDRFGMTALELARYLHKQKSIEILTGEIVSNDFFAQPNVEFHNIERICDRKFKYIHEPIYESTEALSEIFSYTNRAKDLDLISQNRIWMGVYFDKEIQLGIHPPITVQWIHDEIGFGLFAKERIMPCAFVGEFTGMIQERKAENVRESNYCFSYSAWNMGKRRYVIDAKQFGNFTRFINHSDEPNLSLTCVYWRGSPRLLFVSLKEISKQTQLTVDYGKTFWNQSKHLRKIDL